MKNLRQDPLVSLGTINSSDIKSIRIILFFPSLFCCLFYTWILLLPIWFSHYCWYSCQITNIFFSHTSTMICECASPSRWQLTAQICEFPPRNTFHFNFIELKTQKKFIYLGYKKKCWMYCFVFFALFNFHFYY